MMLNNMKNNQLEVNNKRWLNTLLLPDEEFRDVKDYEGVYQVSNYGRVRSINRNLINCKNVYQNFKGRILKQRLDKHGYLRVGFSFENKFKLKQVHRLVAEAFIDNPDNKPTVNHIDGNKLNNNADNLEWNTYKEQTNNAIKLGLIDFTKLDYKKINEKVISKTRKPINQYDLDGNYINSFIGVNEAQRLTKINNISRCLTGKKKSVAGYIWKYAEECEVEQCIK